MPPTPLKDSELNAASAEMMGWWKHEVFWYKPVGDREARYAHDIDGWSPATNASHDYEVLVYVRATWDFDERLVFALALRDLDDGRTPSPLKLRGVGYSYTVGDYARAARSAVETEP